MSVESVYVSRGVTRTGTVLPPARRIGTTCWPGMYALSWYGKRT